MWSQTWAGPCTVCLLQNKRNFSFGCAAYLFWRRSRREQDYLAQQVGVWAGAEFGLTDEEMSTKWKDCLEAGSSHSSRRMEIVLPFFASRDSKALEQHSSLISLAGKSEAAFLSTCAAASCIVLESAVQLRREIFAWLTLLFWGVCVEPWMDKRDRVRNYLRQMFGCLWIKQLTRGSGCCHGQPATTLIKQSAAE